MVHITSANIYRPELSDVMLPNCKSGLEMQSRCVPQRQRRGICEHIVSFATIPWTHNLKDVYEIFPTSLTAEESDFPTIRSEGQIQKINLIIKW